MTSQTYRVSGMTCDHCIAAVTEEISLVPGVTAVAIDLQAGGESVVTVTSDESLDVDAVRGAVDEAGYELIG